MYSKDESSLEKMAYGKWKEMLCNKIPYTPGNDGAI